MHGHASLRGAALRSARNRSRTVMRSPTDVHRRPNLMAADRSRRPFSESGGRLLTCREEGPRSWLFSPTTPATTDLGIDCLGRRLGCLPDAKLPAAEPRAGGHRWLPDIQPPSLDRPAGAGGHPRADRVDHQPRPQGHDSGIDRDGLPGAGPARSRDPLAGMAAHLEDAKLDPASAGRARRRQLLRGLGRARR